MTIQIELTEEERLALLDATAVWLAASHATDATAEETTRSALRSVRAKLASLPKSSLSVEKPSET